MATTDIGELLVKLSADLKNLESGLGKARNDLSGFQGYAQGFASSLKKTLAMAGVAVGLWEIAGAVKSFAKDAAMTGARTETLRVAMEQVGKNAGLSAQSLEYFVNQLKAAGITSQEAMLGVTKFLTTGLDLGKIRELATRARDIAVVANVNTSEAFGRLIHGIVSGETETLRRLMVNIGHIDDLLKRHAATLGIQKDQIDAVTRSNLIFNAVLESTARFAGAAAAADATVGKQLQSMARYAEEAKNALWALFQPVMLAGVQAMSQGWKDLEKWAKANQETLAQYGQALGEFVVETVKAARAVVEFAAEIKGLLRLLAELWIAGKIAGAFIALAGGIKTTAKEVGLLVALFARLKAIIGGPWKLIITISLVGFYEAWQKIQELKAAAPDWRADKPLAQNIREARERDKGRLDADLDKQALQEEARRRGTTPEDIQRIQKENLQLRGKYQGKPLSVPVKELPPVLPEHETTEEKAAREANEAQERAKKEAETRLTPPKAPKAGGGGKGAAEKSTEDLLSHLTAYLEAKRKLELQEAEESYQTFRAAQEKKKAELELWLAEGRITGQEYYAALKAMAEEEAAAAIKLIEAKIAKEKEAQIWAVKEISDKAAKGEITPEGQDLALKKLAAEHALRLKELEGEALREKIGLEKEHLDLLRQEYDNRQRLADLMASGREEAALGPIAEKEAEINRLLRERWKLREELIRLGAAPAQVAEFDQITKDLEINKRFGDQITAYTNLISGFFGDLVDAILDGEKDLRKSLEPVFQVPVQAGPGARHAADDAVAHQLLQADVRQPGRVHHEQHHGHRRPGGHVFDQRRGGILLDPHRGAEQHLRA
jgi:hypothetical protein